MRPILAPTDPARETVLSAFAAVFAPWPLAEDLVTERTLDSNMVGPRLLPESLFASLALPPTFLDA